MAKEKGVEQTINGQLHIENKNIAANTQYFINEFIRNFYRPSNQV